jgi:WD40 repeat protein
MNSKGMRTRYRSPKPEPTDDAFGAPGSVSEIEADIKPPLQRRFVQIVFTVLLLTTIGSLVTVKMMSDQRQKATQEKESAIAAQSTAEALAFTPAAPADISSILPAQSPTTVPAIQAEITSRELAYVSLGQLEVDPERAILIALEANKAAHTAEAEDALRRALQESYLRLRLADAQGFIRSAAFAPDGGTLMTVSSFGPVKVWNVQTGVELFHLPETATVVLSAQYSPDGAYLLTTTADTPARLWDAHTGKPVATHDSGSPLVAGRFSADGRHIVAGGSDGSVRIWTPFGGETISNALVLPGTVLDLRKVAWSSSGGLILALSQVKMMVWSAQTGKLLFQTGGERGAGELLDAQFSADGQWVALSEPARVRILVANTGQAVQTFPANYAENVLFSPDGRLLLAGQALWDLRTGQHIFSFPSRYGFPAQFSPDAKLLVTQGDLPTLNVWDVHSVDGIARRVFTLKGDSDHYAALFAPDGQTIVSIGTDGMARIWSISHHDDLPADYGGLLALARTRVTRELTPRERLTYLRETPTP